jgi:hypothetical protein
MAAGVTVRGLGRGSEDDRPPRSERGIDVGDLYETVLERDERRRERHELAQRRERRVRIVGFDRDQKRVEACEFTTGAFAAAQHVHLGDFTQGLRKEAAERAAADDAERKPT